jgi:predicted membrane protein
MTGIGRILTPHAVVGICFVLLGSALVLDKVDVLPLERSLQFWPLVLILFGASVIAQNGRKDTPETPESGSKDLFPVGLLVWLLIIGFLLAVGFQRNSEVNADSGEDVSLFALMGGRNERIAGTRFQSGEMTSVMGGTVLDLRDAVVHAGEEAVVDVFALMGGVVLRVPSEWTVDVQVTPIMGGVKDERWKPLADAGDAGTAAAPGAPRLVVRGVALMGGVVIK